MKCTNVQKVQKNLYMFFCSKRKFKVFNPRYQYNITRQIRHRKSGLNRKKPLFPKAIKLQDNSLNVKIRLNFRKAIR